MSTHQYIGQSQMHPSGIADHMSRRRSPIAQPPASSYPDVPTYAVTTSSQPQQTDHIMLTPSSGVGSPSFQTNGKLMHQQHPAENYYASPSSSSTMWHGYDMSAPHSQAASPLPVNYAHIESPVRDEIPEPPIPYFGAYGVSGQQDPDQTSLSPENRHDFYMHTNDPMLGTTLMAAPDMTMVPQTFGRPLAPNNPMPFHAQHLPNHFHTQHSTLPDGQDLGGRRQSQQLNFPSTQFGRPKSESINSRDGNQMPRVQRKPRVRNRNEELPESPPLSPSPPSQQSQLSHLATPLATPSSSSAPHDLSDELVFKPNCPPQERFLFEKRYGLERQKGSGMWDTIRADFNAKFDLHSEVPRLQMMCTRGRIQFLELSPRDREILRQSMIYAEKQFFKTVFQNFKERGGGATSHWGLADVEAHAVEQGWANLWYEPAPMDPSVNIRRRRKMDVRRRSNAAANANADSPVPLSPAEREQVLEEILVERGIKPEDEDPEMVACQELRQMQLALPQQRQVKLQPAGPTEEATQTNRRPARGAKAPIAAAKPRTRGRAQKSKAT
ncbi:hypothetical protein C8035_v003660 [Colletotrichum spinosum]|uniref:Uncharacterized protein n=1 Tax=Colletotrichum spinosum TaxID=1347390 RepID=A0A4R8QYN1_9PEZI|nr:hypothetical protein C8035_v003660 [Colletotrichum spinosum]